MIKSLFTTKDLLEIDRRLRGAEEVKSVAKSYGVTPQNLRYRLLDAGKTIQCDRYIVNAADRTPIAASV